MSSDLSLNWDFGDFEAALITDANRTAGLTLDAIEGIGKDILSVAKEHCPTSSGNLKKSGRLTVKKGSTDRRETVTVTFGGKKAPYAFPVHYNPDLPDESEQQFLRKAVDHVAPPGQFPEVVSRRYKSRQYYT